MNNTQMINNQNWISVSNSFDSSSVLNSLTIRTEIEELIHKVENVNRAGVDYEVTFGKKMCPTRHGCTGATNCNYCYGDYPG